MDFDSSAFGEFFAHIPASGTLFNVALILFGSMMGMLIGKRIPKALTDALISVIGVFILYLGFSMANSGAGMLKMLFSIIGGTAAGELLGINNAINSFGEWAKGKLRMRDERFSDAFVSTSLIYCMGSLAILGSIEDGLGGFPAILTAKAVMDGVSALVFSASLGVGVAFSAFSILVYQGSITLLASVAQSIMTDPVIESMSSVGGLMLICVGLNLLGITKIKTSNQIPAILFAAVLGAAL
ncbi:membrane protein [Synergistales bacterium]|nr:membrane protein [Synergistales bacterium]